MDPFIPVNLPKLYGNELQYLTQCIETGWISSEGPFVAEFERRFADRIGRKHAIAVSSGTAALSVAIAALRLEPGSEVIVPTLMIISCVEAIMRNGLCPVLVDAEADTWNMAIADIEKNITPRTRAILVAHLYGLPADMDPLQALADKHGLIIIEDAAEMLGQTYKNRNCGTFGALSTFSFYPNKLITTGEGGMVVTDDDEFASRARRFRNLCFEPQRRFLHEEMGWNFRLTNLQAAVGLAQLEHLDEAIPRKRAIGRRYQEGLSGLKSFEYPVAQTSFADNIYWVYALVLTQEVPGDALDAMERLRLHGVGTRPFFWPMHEQPVFLRQGLFIGQSHPVAERLARRGFYLPSGLGMTDGQIDTVIQRVRELFS
ncbi:MAG: DegT/DnrJ/EryC1/StrS family aminotransferase [Verrucomicrobiota bacterium]|nr:DegT/DnrJ/EryC1/StrS family aminotransferase [Verrucomicrobiota bacterium]